MEIESIEVPKKRRSFTLAQRMAAVKRVRSLARRERLSIAAASKRLGFSQSLVSKWMRDGDHKRVSRRGRRRVSRKAAGAGVRQDGEFSKATAAAVADARVSERPSLMQLLLILADRVRVIEECIGMGGVEK